MDAHKNTQNKFRRVVVKFGTAILTLPNGRLNEALIGEWVDLLADLAERGKQILIVSSGAIGAGVGELDLATRPDSLPDQQAVAAIGQSRLMHVYSEAFRARGRHVAQILLTRGDMDDRRRHLNTRNCLHRLMGMGVIPIINENDTVAVDELCFGHNDILAAIIASKIDADALVLLSDVDGLYDKDPKCHSESRLISRVEKVDAVIEAMAGESAASFGSGGMRAKILAAQAATRAGVPVWIANGYNPAAFKDILAGKQVGTRFDPHGGSRLSARKRWIALGAQTSQRRLIVDGGARRALVDGKKSLLPAGVSGVEGKFEKGDAIEICDEQGRCFAKGLTNYSSEEMRRIQGRQSSEIESLLGGKRYDEAVHRDNLVVLEVS